MKTAQMASYAGRDAEEMVRRTDGFEKLKASYNDSLEACNSSRAKVDQLSASIKALQEENEHVARDLESYGAHAATCRAQLDEKVAQVDETMRTSFLSISELLQACIHEQKELDGLEAFISENEIDTP